MTVYLNLYVTDIESTIDFYVNKLGLFELVADRLVCKFGPELILDLRTSDKVSKVDFGIRFENGLSILSLLEKFEIPYELKNNIAGSHLHFEDPNGNKIWLSTHCGELT